MKQTFLLSLLIFAFLNISPPAGFGQILDNTPLNVCNTTPGCLQNSICTLTDESFKFDYFGTKNLGNGKSLLKFRITNYSEQIFKLATFELPGNGISTTPATKPNFNFRNIYNHSVINPYNDSLIAFEARNASIYNYGRYEDYYYIVNTADITSPGGRKVVVTAKAGRNWKLQHTGSVQFNLDVCENTSGRVTLRDFSGITTSEGIALSWKTSATTQNNRFEIERSHDGLNFTKIGTVNGTEDPSSSDHTYLDRSNAAADNFYRLNLLSFDGTSNLQSFTIEVQPNFKAANLEVKLTPNPCPDENCNIQILNINSKTPLQLEINDLTGKLIFSKELPANQNNLELNRTALGKGVYILTVKNGNQTTYQKIVIQ